MRGRPRKPIEQHEASGAYDKDPQRRNGNAPPKLDGWPDCKDDDPEVIHAYHWFADMLQRKGMACESYGPAAELLSAAYVDWYRIRAKWKEQGYPNTQCNDKGNLSKHPLWTVLKEAEQKLSGYMAKFGITPADRSRVVVELSPDDDEEEFTL